MTPIPSCNRKPEYLVPFCAGIVSLTFIPVVALILLGIRVRGAR